jgi:probable F420-dependent oxidoreductase
MQTYLDVMDAARMGPEPFVPARRLLAALGPRMLELASRRALGAHTYFVPVEHTARARRELGPEPVLAVEQTVVWSRDAAAARALARAWAADYLELPNYANNWRRLGYADELTDGGSDRLIDAGIAWGSSSTIGERVHEHLDAGADHVCVQVIADDDADVCLPQLRDLGEVLLRPLS